MQEEQNQSEVGGQAEEVGGLTESIRQSDGPTSGCRHCDEYLNGWKRAQADYANLKKDMDRLRLDVVASANERAILGILPALDQFETALDHAPDLNGLPEDAQKRIKSWVDGVKAVKSLWEQSLKDFGLENVDTSGTFDPTKHDAVGKTEDESRSQDAIVKTVRRGWMMNGKVIRPAAVIVNSLNNDKSE